VKLTNRFHYHALEKKKYLTLPEFKLQIVRPVAKSPH
jgi:hypothetical protein